MKIIRNLEVPTGNILVVETDNGKIECLSLGDYGKDVNLNQNKDVKNGTPLLPLTEKWVATLSTQFSCRSRCKFCDCPKANGGNAKNASYSDLKAQLFAVLALHPEVRKTKRLNIHFARMGEPTFNENVLDFAASLPVELHDRLNGSLIHPVVSTMLPKKNRKLFNFLSNWMFIKNVAYRGDAGLQLSINSTDDTEREDMFGGCAKTIEEVSRICKKLPSPVGRKITLNFAVAGYTVDAKKLKKLFDPSRFVCKLTPMHKTAAAVENGVKTEGDYTTPEPYLAMADALKNEGFDVLTFIASEDEDLSRITCGNAILSGTMPHKYTEVFNAEKTQELS